jgi:phage baseplate assembly protein W
VGTHRDTGERLEGLLDVEQATSEVLSTPLRSRPLAPDFGTDLLSLVDRPMSPEGRAITTSLTADAVARWERRIQPDRVHVDANGAGEVTVTLDGTFEARRAQASSTPVVVDEPRRLLHPAAYFDRSSFDPALRTWRSRVGGASLGAVPAELGLEDVASPNVLAAEGVRFDGDHAATIVGELRSGPGSLRAPWTIAIAWRPDALVPGAIALAVEIVAPPGTIDEAAYAFPWVLVGGEDNGPAVTLSFLDTASTYLHDDVTGLREGWITTWVWYSPAGARPGRFGWESPSGAREIALGAASLGGGVEEDDVRSLLAVGGSWVGDAFSTGTLQPMVMWAPYIAWWPRLLTRRERLAIDALWRRELRT